MKLRDRWEDVFADIASALARRYLEAKKRERAELARAKADTERAERERQAKLEARLQASKEEQSSSEDFYDDYYPDYEGEDLEDADD
jgi:hypothetical protein